MQNDVTAGYIMTDTERIRKPMQQITDFLLKAMGVKKSSDIVQLPSIKVITQK